MDDHLPVATGWIAIAAVTGVFSSASGASMVYVALVAIAPLAIAHSVHAAVHWWEDVESLYPAITHLGQLLVVLGVVGIHQSSRGVLPFSFAVTLLSVGITSIVAGYVGWRGDG